MEVPDEKAGFFEYAQNLIRIKNVNHFKRSDARSTSRFPTPCE
jgi:hypothetical protein